MNLENTQVRGAGDLEGGGSAVASGGMAVCWTALLLPLFSTFLVRRIKLRHPTDIRLGHVICFDP